MKIRKGFVSNSSSSSFVIYTKDLPKETLKKLTDKLNEMLEDEEIGGEWGDNGKTFYKSGNFIEIETYYLPDSWWTFWKNLEIPKEFIYNID